MIAKAKICGVSTPEAVRAALNSGAGFLGFVFFEASPRNLAPEAAARLAEPARDRGVKVVALAVNPSDEAVDRIARDFAPDLIQLHGQENPSRVCEVAARAGAGAIKSLAVSESADIDAAVVYESVVEHLMFDAKPPKAADRPGGLGISFDWSLLKDRRFRRPWFLAGGLDPWNVAEAICLSGAPLVDVSSGVERGPGLKDAALITAFLDAVRRA